MTAIKGGDKLKFVRLRHITMKCDFCILVEQFTVMVRFAFAR